MEELPTKLSDLTNTLTREKRTTTEEKEKIEKATFNTARDSTVVSACFRTDV